MRSNKKWRILESLYVLSRTDDLTCVPFQPIIDETGYSREDVKEVIQWLSGRGLCKFYRGLMTDEGTVAGSGYVITESGCNIFELFEAFTGDQHDER